MALPQAKMALVLNSPLWKPVFRHQMCPELGEEASWPTHPHQDSKEVFMFLILFIWNGKCLLIFITLNYKHLCLYLITPTKLLAV